MGLTEQGACRGRAGGIERRCEQRVLRAPTCACLEEVEVRVTARSARAEQLKRTLNGVREDICGLWGTVWVNDVWVGCGDENLGITAHRFHDPYRVSYGLDALVSPSPSPSSRRGAYMGRGVCSMGMPLQPALTQIGIAYSGYSRKRTAVSIL